MNKRCYFLLVLFAVLLITGCQTIATRDDVDVVKGKVDLIEGDLFATSKAVGDRFAAQDRRIEEAVSEIKADMEELNKKLSGSIGAVEGKLSRDTASLSEDLASLKSETRALLGKIDEVDHKYDERIKKDAAETERREFELRRDLEGLKKTYTDMITSVSSVTANFSAVQNDINALSRSQATLAEAVNRLIEETEKNAREGRQRSQAIEEAMKKNVDLLLAEIARQEKDLFDMNNRLDELKQEVEGFSLQAPGENSYVVRSGDSLIGIAGRFSTTVTELKRINNLTSDLIKPGQVLIIP